MNSEESAFSQDQQNREITLANMASYYRVLLENVPDALFVLNTEWKITFANTWAEEIFGYSREDLDLRSLADLLIQPTQAMPKIQEITLLPPDGQGRSVECFARHQSGNVLPVEISAVRSQTSQGTMIMVSVREISARKQAEQTMRKLSHAVRFSSAMTIIADRSGCIEYVNRKFIEVTGFAEEDVCGQQMVQFYQTDSTNNAYGELWETVTVGQEWQGELQARRKNNQDYWARMLVAPVLEDNGDLSSVVVMQEDITVQKQYERSLHEAMEAAKAANAAKSEFLANMSHEIRTPLNAVIGLAQLCIQTRLNPQQRDYLDKIASSAQSLLGIINDILDFSKIEANKLELEETNFSLDSVFKNVSTMLSIRALEKNIELLFDVPPSLPEQLVGDPLRLGQILTNLTNNAVKFTERGEVVIAVEELERATDIIRLRFTVRDTGIGIPAEQLSQLFRSFTQVDSSTTRKYGGTGLGLAICKRLVEMMGGEIRVQSTVHQGTSFSFELSLRMASSRPASRQMIANCRNLRALIVDDNRTSCQILEQQLQALELQTEAVHSGEEALRRVGRGAFDLVLIDWRLGGGMDGIRTAKLIGSELELEKLPKILLVTAYGRDDLWPRAQQAGVGGMLIKPIQKLALHTALNNLLQPNADPDGTDSFQSNKMAEPDLSKIRGSRILLVEDNELNQQLATELLRQRNFVVDVAPNGQEALNVLRRQSYDLVLMDVQMPVMDGYEATRFLRRLPQFKELPIIAMTANALHTDREQALEVGMNDHIPKPIELQLLLSKLLQWIPPKKNETTVPTNQPLESPPKELPANVPGLAIATALNRLNQNTSLYLRLLDVFQRNQSNTAEKMQELLAEENLVEAARLAHTLKGIAGSLGAKGLETASRTAEAQLREGNVVPDSLATLEKELKQVLKAVADLLAR
ncbi:MAG: response regulator [bacterium]